MAEERNVYELIDQRIDARLEAIADRAAERALQKVYAEVGRHVLTRLAWLVGAAAVALALFLASKGYFK